MSLAKKCDRCEKLYEQVPGTVDVEYDICELKDPPSPDDGNDELQFQGWEVNLCQKCSKQFLLFIDQNPEEK